MASRSGGLWIDACFGKVGVWVQGARMPGSVLSG